MTTETRTTLRQFIGDFRIRMTADLTERNPNRDDEWGRSATHWKCLLRCGRRSMTVYFSQGPAVSREPSAEDVLDCLASDAAGFENARTFEEWASEYGYDADSRKAERTYKAVERQTEALARLLPVDAYDRLLWHTERL